MTEPETKPKIAIPCLGMDGACTGCSGPLPGLRCSNPPWSKQGAPEEPRGDESEETRAGSWRGWSG